jgi:hypothetical protein
MRNNRRNKRASSKKYATDATSRHPARNAGKKKKKDKD